MDLNAGDHRTDPDEDVPSPGNTSTSVPGEFSPLQTVSDVAKPSIVCPSAGTTLPADNQPPSTEALPSVPATQATESSSSKLKKKVSSWFPSSSKKKDDKGEGASGSLTGRLPTAEIVTAATGTVAAVTGSAGAVVAASPSDATTSADAPDAEFKAPETEVPSETPTDNAPMPDAPEPTSQPTFRWPTGMKVPQGSMTADGKLVPDGAEPQPDGSVKLLSGSVIPAEGVVLPDGVKLSDVTKPTDEAPKPVASMPDGSTPSTQQGSYSWTIYSLSLIHISEPTRPY